LLNVLARTPVRLVLPAVLLAGGAAGASGQQPPAQPVPQAEQQQREHVVRRGDTLWDLARTYLGNPFRWPLIFEANQDVVENPHWIYPSERLRIPPLLQRLQHEGGVQPVLPDHEPPPAQQPQPQPQPGTPPEPPTVITTIDARRPIMTVGQYLGTPWLAAAGEAVPQAGVVRKADPAAAQGRLAPTLLPDDRVHVALAGMAVAAGDTLVVVRPGRNVGEWGHVMQPLGLLRVETAAGGEAVARLVAQFGDARVGDLVMRPGIPPEFALGQPEDVQAGPQGELLAFLHRQPLYGTTDIAFISLGRAHGVGIGDEFAVYVPAGTQLPAERVGVVRVVRVGDRTSTVRVVAVTSTALGDGLPVRMIRKMP
jgi:hypothetical protein